MKHQSVACITFSLWEKVVGNRVSFTTPVANDGLWPDRMRGYNGLQIFASYPSPAASGGTLSQRERVCASR
jgi:hypothetical protein